jgi:hypothetical protein
MRHSGYAEFSVSFWLTLAVVVFVANPLARALTRGKK